MKKTETRSSPARNFFGLPRHIQKIVLDWKKTRAFRRLVESRSMELEFENLVMQNEILKFELKRARALRQNVRKV